jgi:hypothetical protein
MAALKPMGRCTKAARARTAPGKPPSQESQKGVIRLMQRCSDPAMQAWMRPPHGVVRAPPRKD